MNHLRMKALLPIFVLTFSSYTAAAAASGMGLLANYYHDCPVSRGPNAASLRRVSDLHYAVTRPPCGPLSRTRASSPLATTRATAKFQRRYCEHLVMSDMGVRDQSVGRSPRCSTGFTSCADERFRAHIPKDCEVVSRVDLKSASHVQPDARPTFGLRDTHICFMKQACELL